MNTTFTLYYNSNPANFPFLFFLKYPFFTIQILDDFGFARETMSENQPKGIDVFKMPASLFIRAYTNKHTAMLISKEHCDIWELFSYIRDYFMPAQGFKMADNGAQEMEVYDTAEHKVGYVYMPVKRA